MPPVSLIHNEPNLYYYFPITYNISLWLYLSFLSLEYILYLFPP